MADWSLLPSDLIRCIADCLLTTNDLDCYIDFRAVCPNWRSATDDPTNSSDLRFHPRQWIIIDEVFQSDERLMVNTATGRVLRKDLPMLRRYYIVAVTTNGALFVLADREHPHAASVLNPFTGHMIRFTAATPYNMEVTSAAFSCGSSPSLRLLWESDKDEVDGSCELYAADPYSEFFTVYEDEDYSYVLKRLAIVGGICNDGELPEPVAPLPVAVAERIFHAVKLPEPEHDFDFYEILMSAVERAQLPEECHLFQRYDLLESAGKLILIARLQNHFKVFRLNTDRIVLEPVESIGNLAFFVGQCRYMSVSADKFSSIDANCIYYVKSTDSFREIYKYDLEVRKEVMVSEAIGYLNGATLSSFACPPFTIVQLLSSYTINTCDSELRRKARRIISGTEFEYAYGPGSCWCLNMTEVRDPENYQRKPHCIRA